MHRIKLSGNDQIDWSRYLNESEKERERHKGVRWEKPKRRKKADLAVLLDKLGKKIYIRVFVFICVYCVYVYMCFRKSESKNLSSLIPFFISRPEVSGRTLYARLVCICVGVGGCVWGEREGPIAGETNPPVIQFVDSSWCENKLIHAWLAS